MATFTERRARTFNCCYWLRDDLLAQWLMRHLSGLGRSVCDVGAGDGFMVEHYRRHFERVMAVEPNPYFAESVATLYRGDPSIVVVNRGVQDLPTAESFDLVISKSALHHFPDDRAGLSAMAALSSGSIAIVEVALASEACREFITELLITKERGRNPATAYSSRDLQELVGSVAMDIRSLYFDQYIDLHVWVESSDLSTAEQDAVLAIVRRQPREIKKIMQIHEHDGTLRMLRRVNLVYGRING